MSLLTLAILGIVALSAFVTGLVIKSEYNKNGLKDTLLIVSGLSLVIILVGGFGAHAVNNYEYMIVKEIKADTILKTKATIFVEFYIDDYVQKYVSEKIIDYTTITDSTKFYLVEYYNYYGVIQQVRYNVKHYITWNKTFSEYVGKNKVESIEID